MTPADLWMLPGPWSVAELATACRCSKRFVQTCIEAGALPACRVGRNFRIKGSDALAFASSVGVEAPSDAHRAHAAPAAHNAHGVAKFVRKGSSLR